MQFRIDVNAEAVKDLFRRLRSYKPLELGAVAGYQFLRFYHELMDWKGDRYLGPGPDSGQFARNVVEGWQLPQFSGDQATVVNTFGLLAWKVTGGTITAVNAQFLTIPLVLVAKGVRVRDYPDKLFRAGNALCIKLGDKVQAIYALKATVVQEPWPGAMPETKDLQTVVYYRVRTGLQEVLR